MVRTGSWNRKIANLHIYTFNGTMKGTTMIDERLRRIQDERMKRSHATIS